MIAANAHDSTINSDAFLCAFLAHTQLTHADERHQRHMPCKNANLPLRSRYKGTFGSRFVKQVAFGRDEINLNGHDSSFRAQR